MELTTSHNLPKENTPESFEDLQWKKLPSAQIICQQEDGFYLIHPVHATCETCRNSRRIQTGDWK